MLTLCQGIAKWRHENATFPTLPSTRVIGLAVSSYLRRRLSMPSTTRFVSIFGIRESHRTSHFCGACSVSRRIRSTKLLSHSCKWARFGATKTVASQTNARWMNTMRLRIGTVKIPRNPPMRQTSGGQKNGEGRVGTMGFPWYPRRMLQACPMQCLSNANQNQNQNQILKTKRFNLSLKLRARILVRTRRRGSH